MNSERRGKKERKKVAGGDDVRKAKEGKNKSTGLERTFVFAFEQRAIKEKMNPGHIHLEECLFLTVEWTQVDFQPWRMHAYQAQKITP